MSIDSHHEKKFRPVTNWAPIFGLWNFKDRRSIYGGPPDGQRPFGMCGSGACFSEGEARVTLRQPSGRSGSVDGPVGGHGSAYTIVQFKLGTGWRPFVAAGTDKNLQADRSYKITIRLHRQRITLRIDGVRVLEHVLEAPLTYGQLGLFAWGKQGGVEFSDASVREKPATAFVVMQLKDNRFQELYKQIDGEVREAGEGGAAS